MAAPAGVLFFSKTGHDAVFGVWPNGLVRHVLGAEFNAYGRPRVLGITDEVDYQNFKALADAVQATPVT